MNFKLILASASPRRRELIKYLSLPFECKSADIDEILKFQTPEENVLHISAQKAKAVLNQHKLDINQVIIGADTVVAIDNCILGKPSDKEDAINTLKKLQNKTHRVLTGVTFIYKSNKNNKIEIHEKSFYEATEVTFAPISDLEIERYVSTKDCFDKAGSYAIQGEFSIHISNINGDYNNVVGFPVSRIYQELKKIK